MKWMKLTDFGVRLYGGSELSKLFKLLATDAINAINQTRSKFYDDENFKGSVKT